jgi:hypothetical protein
MGVVLIRGSGSAEEDGGLPVAEVGNIGDMIAFSKGVDHDECLLLMGSVPWELHVYDGWS